MKVLQAQPRALTGAFLQQLEGDFHLALTHGDLREGNRREKMSGMLSTPLTSEYRSLPVISPAKSLSSADGSAPGEMMMRIGSVQIVSFE